MRDIGLLDDMPARVWEMAAVLVESKRKPSRRSDLKHVRRAYHFLRRYAQATSLDKLTLRRDYPDLYWAFGMYDDPRSERWLIEAALLTDVSYEELSEYSAKPVEVIKTYETTFYDIRGRKGARGYILNQVLLPSFERGMHGRDFDLLYKTLAYCAGWDVFKQFVDAKELTDDARAYLTTSFKDRMLKVGWMAAHRIQVNNYTALEVIDKCIRLQELEVQNKSSGPTGDEAMQLLGGLLETCVTTMLPTKQSRLLDEPRITGHSLKYGDPIPVGAAEESNGEAKQG